MTTTYAEQQTGRPRREVRSVLGTGVLLAVDGSTGRVVAASGNAPEVFGPRPILGTAVDELLPLDTAQTLRALLQSGASSPGRPSLIDASLRGVAGRRHELYHLASAGLGLIEIVAPVGPIPRGVWSSDMAAAREQMMKGEDIAESSGPILRFIPAWTGFEGAAVLELRPDGALRRVSGDPEVGPEALSPELAQLLAGGRCRCLSDRLVEPSPIETAVPGLALDLGHAELQPAFPCETEGGAPRARWLLPIRIGSRLWGVVAAESRCSPVLVRHSLRSMIQALVDGLSSRLWLHARGVSPMGPVAGAPLSPPTPLYRGGARGAVAAPALRPGSSPRAPLAGGASDVDQHMSRLEADLAHVFVLHAESAAPLSDLEMSAMRLDELRELLEVGRRALAPEPTTLAKLLEGAALTRSLRLAVETQADVPIRVDTDALRAVLRAAQRRIPGESRGHEVRFDPGELDGSPRLVVRAVGPVAGGGSRPAGFSAELPDAIARAWGGGVYHLAPRGEVVIDLGQNARPR